MIDLKGTPAILSSYSGPTLALAPLALRQKVVLINAGAQADNLAQASPYLFNTTPIIADEVAALADYLHANHGGSAAILYENDSAGISGRDYFVTGLFRLTAEKPDVIFVNLTAGTKQLADQYHQLNLSPTIVGTSCFSDPTLIADPAASGWLHTQVTINAPAELVSEFESGFHEPITFHVRQWYNGTLVLLTAMQSVLAKGQQLVNRIC